MYLSYKPHKNLCEERGELSFRITKNSLPLAKFVFKDLSDLFYNSKKKSHQFF